MMGTLEMEAQVELTLRLSTNPSRKQCAPYALPHSLQLRAPSPRSGQQNRVYLAEKLNKRKSGLGDARLSCIQGDSAEKEVLGESIHGS